ncbi:hypothetical protein [Labrys monachus]|uniref:DUF1134 domain-containing protein n=1 Tax=Labrys monachus TaxID=217067 RepID=A0ABU0F907_9HYPH|nr:hypothetical protein [Labrys monachus]MDQ0391069.1 hypothetical protein [Labrys monachus]
MTPTLKTCLVAASLFCMSAPAFAQNAPDATITFSGGSVAAGVGYTWGSGTLRYKGKAYPFTVSGLSVVDVGAARIDGTGTVYNLRNVADAAGTYVAAGVGATIAGGGTVAALQNQNGVIVHFHSTTAGLKLHLSASGIVIKLK